MDTAKKYGKLADPVNEFSANGKKVDASLGPIRQPIGLFDFVDGKSLLNAFLRKLQIVIQAGARVPARLENVVAAKLIHKVQPEYPEAARKLRI